MSIVDSAQTKSHPCRVPIVRVIKKKPRDTLRPATYFRIVEVVMFYTAEELG
jgi:hypothetical protein